MKTLILNGSPRINGDTNSLIKELLGNVGGEFMVVNAYRSHISPCIDCRYCWDNRGSCAIKDEMQDVYDYIQQCDNILIASPVYFSEVTGKLLDVASRLQAYYCSGAFGDDRCIEKPKKGAAILVGGGDGDYAPAISTITTLLDRMNCTEVHETVVCRNTNERPAHEDEETVKKIRGIAEFFGI